MEELRSEGIGNTTLQGRKCRGKALGAVQMHYGDKVNVVILSENKRSGMKV